LRRGASTLGRHPNQRRIRPSGTGQNVTDIYVTVESVLTWEDEALPARASSECDEVHRFNKSQQDALLPSVEDGTLTLIGATTENPFFEVNGPLLSRSTLFRLEPLDAPALRTLLDRGLKSEGATIEPEAADLIVDSVETAGPC